MKLKKHTLLLCSLYVILKILNIEVIFFYFRRRIETYRRRQSECVPRFDQSFSGACEQQNLETSALQKRFIEGKAKRQAKKNDRKPDLPTISSNLHSSVVHVVRCFYFQSVYITIPRLSHYMHIGNNDDTVKIYV